MSYLAPNFIGRHFPSLKPLPAIKVPTKSVVAAARAKLVAK
jgi:hypothetical protein